MSERDPRAVLEGLPPDAQVPVGWVLEQLGGEATVTDLTCEDVAAQLDRTAACVRGWCRDGLQPGAYRFRGREWRIPAGALNALRGANAHRGDGRRSSGKPVDLGAWREEVA